MTLGGGLRGLASWPPVESALLEPRTSVTRFVQDAARHELAQGRGTRAADVPRRLIERLHQTLGKLIGSAGFHVLLARAIVLVRRTHPELAGITAGQGGALEGLDEAHGGVALDEGALAIVAYFVELLVVLVGEDLAMRLLRDVWPATAREPKK